MTVAKKYGELDDRANLAGWAHRVLDLGILGHYRKHYLHERKLLEVRDEHHPFADWTPDPLFRRTLMECLTRVSRRNHRYARILNLHYQGYDVADVCKAMSITRNNYYVILSRARAMLEECLESGDAK